MGTWKQMALALAAIVVVAAPAAAESTRIGYVNLQQVIAGSKAGQKAQADMKVEVEQLDDAEEPDEPEVGGQPQPRPPEKPQELSEISAFLFVKILHFSNDVA